jgi:tetratricopeptide (TPR) repeat protein
MVLKRIILIFILILSYPELYSYISRFLSLDTNSLEYQVITNPEGFSLEKSALIIAGIKDGNLEDYLDRLSNIEAGISNGGYIAGDEEGPARFLFLRMHKNILKEYDESSTTLDAIIDTGRFNCLSSTLLYNCILEDFGFDSSAVILPSHAYTLLTINGRDIDVENTSPYGFDIGTNIEAQKIFEKLTGYSYSHDPSIAEIVGKKGLLAYTYENLSYFDNKSGKIYESFQDALKSLAIYPEGKFIYSNVSAAYSTYSMYLAEVKKDYGLSLSILKEAIEFIPEKSYFYTNYFYVENLYLNSLVGSSSYDKAFEELDNSAGFTGTNTALEYDLYLNVIYRLITHDGDFERAYVYGKKALAGNPGNENIISIMINGLNLYSQKLLNNWQDYPKGEEFILKWYALNKNEYFDSILENYYNQMGLKFYEYGDPLKAIGIIKKGLSFFPASSPLKNNIVYVTGNTANIYFSKEDYENSIKFIKIGLASVPENQDLKSNLLVTYRTYDSKEIEVRNYTRALAIAGEGLAIFPKDPKLIYYRDYLLKKIK